MTSSGRDSGRVDLTRLSRVEVVADPMPEASSVREHGFSLKIRDPAAVRLFFRQLRRQQSPRTPLVQKSPARAQPRNGQVVAREPRPPLVCFDDVLSAFAIALARAGKTPEEARAWPPIILQDRISRTGDKEDGSTSPERQITNQAEWCVKNHRRPAYLLHEEMSGSIYRHRRRRRFEQFFDDLAHDRILDPITGKPIGEIGCFHWDRFTRDPEEGGDCLRVLRAKSVDLHETYYGADPKPLHEVEHEIRDAWNRGSKEVMRSREREMDAYLRKARLGLPGYHTARMFGHKRVVDPISGETSGYRIVPEEAAVIRTLVDHVVFHNGNTYSVTRYLNDNGYRNSAGGKWLYNDVARLLHAPRLAGLVSLRLDQARLNDPTYRGELFPEELIYEEGEGPSPTFTPPIEPIIPYPLWAKLQAALDGRATHHGPPIRYFASNNVECGTCGAGITGGQVSKRTPQYRCSKPHLKGVTRSGHNRPHSAGDGKRHPTMRVEQLDYILSEVIFAAVDREPDRAIALAEDTTEAEKEVERRSLAALDERLGNNSYMLHRQSISRAQYDEWLDEIEAERRQHRERLQELDDRRPEMSLPEGVTLRELWPDLTVDERREWFSVVFDRVVLKTATNVGAQNIATRLDFTFRDVYEPPAQELQELLLSIERDIRLGTFHFRMPTAILDRIVGLAQQGIGPTEIGRTLSAEGFVGPCGGTRWTEGRVAHLLKQTCRDRGTPYPQRADRGKTPAETRLLIVTLAKKLPSYAAVARELNKLQVPRPNGSPWEGKAVGEVLKRHETRTGTDRPLSPVSIKRGGQQKHLPPAIREKLWQMHRIDRLTLQAIADWLEKSGIRTARGKTKWNRATILYVIRGIDEDRGDTGDDAANAA